MTARKDNALNLGGESGREDQTETDTDNVPQAQPVSQSVDPLIGWHRLGAAVKTKSPRWRSRPSPASPISHHEKTAAGPLYVLPEQPIRGSRK